MAVEDSMVLGRPLLGRGELEDGKLDVQLGWVPISRAFKKPGS